MTNQPSLLDLPEPAPVSNPVRLERDRLNAAALRVLQQGNCDKISGVDERGGSATPNRQRTARRRHAPGFAQSIQFQNTGNARLCLAAGRARPTTSEPVKEREWRPRA